MDYYGILEEDIMKQMSVFLMNSVNLFFYFLIQISNVLFYVLVYFFSLFYLTARDDVDIIHWISSILPEVNENHKKWNEETLKRNIQEIFLSSFKVAFFSALTFWIVFEIFQIKYSFVYIFFIVLVSFIPICSPWWIGFIPFGLQISKC